MRDLLSRMWAHDPRERPCAAQCVVELEALLATVTARLANSGEVFFLGPEVARG
ncbi:hypothetical protein T484DRAFT_1861386 [Baffinella frigidus]|nr:hypothetical protein T484DRAFT_1861386 [Cryptophyta sp. CCMP2293]